MFGLYLCGSLGDYRLLFVYIDICVFVCMYVCMYVCYIYIYIYMQFCVLSLRVKCCNGLVLQVNIYGAFGMF